MKYPRLPTYDPATDGNRFQWILEQSQVVREQRRQVHHAGRFRAGDLELLRRYDAEIEREDEQRLKSLRVKYDQNRNRATKKVA